jgi:hypothetical protein
VGLVQRQIEAAGFSTITLSNIPDLTAAVGAPRIAAIEYPFGLTVGLPGDQAGQQAALRATLAAVQEMTAPGSVRHLPFALPESAGKLNTRPPEIPPIVSYIVRHPWHLPNLWRREVPD